MKFIGMMVSFVLVTAVFWVPIAAGIVALLNGYLIGLLFIGLGIWLALQ